MSAQDSNEDEDRRKFLKSCGRFAAITPPAITLLLSTSLTSRAIGRSGGDDGGKHGDDGRRSFFDNDPPTGSSGTSSGGSFEGVGTPRSHANGTSGGGAGTFGGGSSHGGGGSSTSIASSGTISASGGDCAEEEENEKWRRKIECTLADLKDSSSSGSEH